MTSHPNNRHSRELITCVPRPQHLDSWKSGRLRILKWKGQEGPLCSQMTLAPADLKGVRQTVAFGAPFFHDLRYLPTVRTSRRGINPGLVSHLAFSLFSNSRRGRASGMPGRTMGSSLLRSPSAGRRDGSLLYMLRL